MDNSETTPARLEALERKRMRWDPTVNMGHLMTMATSMVASLVFVMASWSTMDKRVVILEEARLTAVVNARERQESVNDKFSDVKTSLQEIKTSVESLRRDVQEKKR